MKDQRLSDFLNDSRDTSVMLRNSTVARLENPAKIIERTNISFQPKTGIVLAFEPPQKGPPAPQRFMKYPKQQYDVFIITDGMEIRGMVHMIGALDLLHMLANPPAPFAPITKTTVTIRENPDFLLKDVTILLNIPLIRFIGEVMKKKAD